jgi:hypothetical protein
MKREQRCPSKSINGGLAPVGIKAGTYGINSICKWNEIHVFARHSCRFPSLGAILIPLKLYTKSYAWIHISVVLVRSDSFNSTLYGSVPCFEMGRWLLWLDTPIGKCIHFWF